MSLFHKIKAKRGSVACLVKLFALADVVVVVWSVKNAQLRSIHDHTVNHFHNADDVALQGCHDFSQ